MEETEDAGTDGSREVLREVTDRHGVKLAVDSAAGLGEAKLGCGSVASLENEGISQPADDDDGHCSAKDRCQYDRSEKSPGQGTCAYLVARLVLCLSPPR